MECGDWSPLSDFRRALYAAFAPIAGYTWAMEHTHRMHSSIPIVLAWSACAIPLIEACLLNSMKPLPRGSGHVFLMCSIGCGLGLVLAAVSLWQMRGQHQLPRLAILVAAFLALVLNSVGVLAGFFFWALSGLPGP